LKKELTMVNQVLSMRVPVRVAAPVGAAAAAQAALWVGEKAAALGRAVWRVAQAHGRARAVQHLQRLAAERSLSQPERAAMLRELARSIAAEVAP
jgi:hypothetical protein